MVKVIRRHCWLLLFVFFLCFLIPHKCNHSLGSLITLEVLFWAIILFTFITIVSPPTQWRCFTVTDIDCYILSYLFPPTNGWVWPLVGIADYIGSTLLIDHIIPIYHHCFSPSTISSFKSHRCRLLYIWSFLWFLPMDECNHLLGLPITLELLFWAIILSLYFYISLSPLSPGLCGITFVSDFYSSAMALYHRYLCLFFCLLYWFPPCGQARQSIVINDCKIISLPSDRIIVIYHCFIHDPCRIKIAMSHYIVTNFLRNGANISYVSVVWSIIQSVIIYIFHFWAMMPYHHYHGLFLYFFIIICFLLAYECNQ